MNLSIREATSIILSNYKILQKLRRWQSIEEKMNKHDCLFPLERVLSYVINSREPIAKEVYAYHNNYV